MTSASGILTRARSPFGFDAALAGGLLLAAELEVLLGPTAGGSRAVSAIAVALAIAPLAWRRRLPLLPLAALTLVLPLDALLGGFLVERTAVFLAALAIALFTAGCYAGGALRFGAAVAMAVGLVVTRIVFDPGVDGVAQAGVTVVAVALPLLVGRWVRGQWLLQRELDEKAERLAREREAHARQAAEEERMRIAGDLQAAVAGSLRSIIDGSAEIRALLAAGDHEAARPLLVKAAATAREALADVRRVLGILRREDQDRPLTPPDRVGEPAGPVAAPLGVDVRSAAPLAEGSGAAPLAGLSGAAPPGDAGPQRHRRRFPCRGRRADAALVALLLVAAQVELALSDEAGLLAALTPFAIMLPLLARRSQPVLAALGVLAGVALQSALLDPGRFPVADMLAMASAGYSLGAYSGRRQALAGLALVAAGSGVHAAIVHPGAVPIAILGGTLVPWVAGRVVRGQWLLTREAGERSAQVERARAQEAQAAVTAERMRVARELHDAVAHNISVIAIQAAGADGIAERDPARAVEAVELVETVAREALAELGRLVGSAAAAPQPGLARVEALAQRARDEGLPVELRVEGEPAGLPAGMDLAAFRIVQEALANSSKHAGRARAWVVVRYGGGAVELEIADDGRGANGGRPAQVRGSGHGLIGMRERAALYGGTLDTGARPGGGFLVRARLPLGAV